MNHQDSMSQAENTKQPMLQSELKMCSDFKGVTEIDYQIVELDPIKCYFVMPLLSIVTCFIIWIPILKSDKFKGMMLMRRAESIDKGRYVVVTKDKKQEIVKINREEGVSFEYKKVKYVFENNVAVRLRYKPQESKLFKGDQSFMRKGLTMEQQERHRNKYGKCEHVFEVPGLGLFLLDTLTGPFFILQYVTCLLYIWETFYLFSAIMLGTSLITTFINYFLLRRSVIRVKQSTQTYTDVQVLCDGNFIIKNSRDLVPGDIIKPPKNMPCDALLIHGIIFVNQATLTGQSLPIQKIVIQNSNEIKQQKHWLYEGAIIIQNRGEALALVIQTGFNTRKGESFRKMLDRDYENPKFIKSGFVFMIQILIVCSIIFACMIPIMIMKKLATQLIVMRFLDMLGWAIPPTFPIFFNISYSFTLYRLERKRIFASEATKICSAGKLKNIYFDKTGTLTLNQIDLSLIVTFDELGKEKQIKPENLNPSELVTKIFASCHSSRLIDGQMMGDEVDVRMFCKSGYSFQISNVKQIKAQYTASKNTLSALKIHQYESQYRSMSVLIKDESTNQHYVFVKGAPQKLQQCSTNKIQKFDQTVFKMSLSGLRLIAFGYKKINNPQDYLSKNRDEFNNDLTLFGIMGFSNQVRPEAYHTINLLKQSGINVAMITGDNIWTAIQAATRVSIIQNQDILVIQGNKQQPSNQQLSATILSHKNFRNQLIETTIHLNQMQNSPYKIAVDSNFLNSYPNAITSNIKIFARSKPQTKQHIIRTIQKRFQDQWNQKSLSDKIKTRNSYSVGMVGDGANDVMAIKQANVGFGINDCDSSFASDYSVDKLTDVEQVVRNGKSTLSIIIDIFRYYGAISVLKLTTVCIMSLDKSNYNDNQFTYFNYMQTIEIVVFMCITLPTKHKTIYYPNDNLLSLQNHLIFHGLYVIPTISLFIIYQVATHLPDYIPNPDTQYSTWKFQCMTNTLLALSSQFFYVANSILVYTAWPWKQKIFQNKILSTWIFICFLSLISYFIFSSHLSTFFGYVQLPFVTVLVSISIIIMTIIIGQLWNMFIKYLQLQKSS